MLTRRRDRLGILGLALAALALRLAYRIDYDEDIDALRFALAVDRFDVTDLRPHAPFYPVYIALAKGLAVFVREPVKALAVLSALSGAAVVALTARLGGALAGARAAWIAGGLALVSPFLWLSSEKCSSDMTGTAFVSAGLLFAVLGRGASSEAARGRLRTLALFVFGASLGVRLSYWPFAIGCLVAIVAAEGLRYRVVALRLRDLLFGVVVWLVPLVAIAGARPLVTQSRVQMVGHFTRWGGTVMTVSSPAARVEGLVWGLWANVLGGAWTDAPPLRWIAAPILVLLVVLAVRSVGPMRDLVRRQPEVALGTALYVLWVSLGQNIAFKPRHLLPLAPLAIVMLAAGASALFARPRVAVPALAVLVLEWAFDGERLVRAHVAPSPAAALVRSVAASSDPRPILTRELGRMIAVGAPSRRVLTAAGDEELLRAVDAEGASGVLVTSEALSSSVRSALEQRHADVRIVFARPRSRYVESLWSDLALYEIAPPPR